MVYGNAGKCPGNPAGVLPDPDTPSCPTHARAAAASTVSPCKEGGKGAGGP